MVGWLSHEKKPSKSHHIPLKSHEITMWPFADPFPMELPWFSHATALEGAPGGGGLRHGPCGKLPAQHRGDGMGWEPMGWFFFCGFSWYFDGDFRMHMRCFMDFWWGVLGCTWGCLMIFLMKTRCGRFAGISSMGLWVLVGIWWSNTWILIQFLIQWGDYWFSI